jgi:outer membrane autotransporter protein
LESSPAAIRGVLGYEINPNLAVEGLVALGIGDDELRGNGQEIQGVKVEMSSVFGIYAKPKVNFTPELEGFVRVGYARSKITTEAPAGAEASTSKSGFSYGLGVSYALSPQISLNVDYMSYFDQTDPDDAKLTGLAFGASYTF